LHRGDRAIHEVGSVVLRADLDARGQAVMDFPNAAVEQGDYSRGVPLHHDAQKSL